MWLVRGHCFCKQCVIKHTVWKCVCVEKSKNFWIQGQENIIFFGVKAECNDQNSIKKDLESND